MASGGPTCGGRQRQADEQRGHTLEQKPQENILLGFDPPWGGRRQRAGAECGEQGWGSLGRKRNTEQGSPLWESTQSRVGTGQTPLGGLVHPMGEYHQLTRIATTWKDLCASAVLSDVNTFLAWSS